VAAIKGGNSLVTKLRGMASKAAKSPTLSVGFMSGATYPDGTSVATLVRSCGQRVRQSLKGTRVVAATSILPAHDRGEETTLCWPKLSRWASS
jgi:hypothetical protein